jgi:AmiR/NasT family two-component response regulator
LGDKPTACQDDDPKELQSALDIVLRRFAEYHNLEGAFGRRAMIERAKGILMAVYRINEQQAFDMLRSQSQRSGRKAARPAGGTK